MKKLQLPFSAFLLSVLISCHSTNEKLFDQSILLTNSSGLVLKDKGISIGRDKLDVKEGEFPLFRSEDGELIPTQLDDTNGDGKWNEIFMVTDFAANESKKLILEWSDQPAEFTIRTSVRFGKRDAGDSPVQPRITDTLLANGLPKSIGYQPYQTDGPSWENDKVGFRHYFDGRNSKDLFGKKTEKMSLENVGISASGAVEDNYHVMEDWGRDILGVGNSIGLGGFALLNGDRLGRLGVTVEDSINNIERSVFNIISEGPVRSIMTFQYHNWETNDRIYPLVEEKVSIVPGMYAYKNEVKIQGLQGDENLVIGLVNLHNRQPLRELVEFEDWVVLLTHDQQSYDREWIIGMALILPKSEYLGYFEAPKTGDLSNTFLAKMQTENDRPITYYAVGGWEISDEKFRDAVYFENYVKDLVAHLEADIEVKIENN